MKLFAACLGIAVMASSATAAEIIPFDSARWKIEAAEHRVEEHLGKESLLLKGGLAVIAHGYTRATSDCAIVLDLTAYENDVEDSGVTLDWTIDGEEHCVVSGQDSDDDVLTLTPHAGYVGSDTVTLHLRDSQGAEATQEVVVTWQEASQVETLDVRVSASGDDAEERESGFVIVPNGDLEMGVDGAPQTIGLRFQGVTVPQGATIVSAYVQFQADEGDSEPTELTLWGEAVDDAALVVARDLD
mgnify:CR=1 FL=1